jgi:hypothetical protein
MIRITVKMPDGSEKVYTEKGIFYSIKMKDPWMVGGERFVKVDNFNTRELEEWENVTGIKLNKEKTVPVIITKPTEKKRNFVPLLVVAAVVIMWGKK